MNEYEILEDNVRNTFIRIVWTHKIQEKQADILQKHYRNIESLRLVLSAVTSVSLVSTLFHNQFIVNLISTLIAFSLTFLNAFFKTFSIQTRINSHKMSANEFLVLRDELQILLMKIRMMKTDIEDLIDEYEYINKKLTEVYDTSPQTSEKAVKLASKALNELQDNKFSEDEIDQNLPESLRKGDKR